jgi:hypothetical protein
MRDKRFSAVPVVTAILKTIAVLLVLFALYALIQGLRETVASWRGGAGQFGQIPPTLGFGPKLQSLLQPLFSFIQSLFLASLAWGFGELFNMVRLILLGKTPELTPASASED